MELSFIFEKNNPEVEETFSAPNKKDPWIRPIFIFEATISLLYGVQPVFFW